ncbi:MAG: D-aminoacyl-tRNA deacylase [Propionibacteriaceae bacterium]|jgi:D-tyrosyl-tRNA(Tyr) deacylase|nr:D-aminoacyl-tRNA deacylase [Propionibacteriaceae bacterium]
MRVVLQVAARAEVRVGGEVVGRLSRPGLVLLVGVARGDGPAQAEKLADKVWGLRVFDAADFAAADPPEGVASEPVPGAGGSGGVGSDGPVPPKGELSASDLGAPILVVSQFTLYGDARKGRRPSWSAAAPGPEAEPLVEAFAEALRRLGADVETGRFGATMDVELVNRGPVTLILEA